MKIEWTSASAQDLNRIHEHLRLVAPEVAFRIVQQLVAAADSLREHPRLGEKLEGFEPREVRRLVVGKYEIRYELAAGRISVLRVWHGREERSNETLN